MKKNIVLLSLFLMLFSGCSSDNNIDREMLDDMYEVFVMINENVTNLNLDEETINQYAEKKEIVFQKYYIDNGAKLNNAEQSLYVDMITLDIYGNSYIISKQGIFDNDFGDPDENLQKYMRKYNEIKNKYFKDR